jgi:outer membrane protein, heavy metal efflux system
MRTNSRTVVACAVRDILMSLGFFIAIIPVFYTNASAGELILNDLIDEALKNNHEIIMSGAKTAAARFRIPQAGSLPDPMLMIGYQNDGTRDLYTFGQDMATDSMWMFSASQMFPFSGKRALKSDMARKDAESLQAGNESLRLNTIARVKELYYSLFLVYKDIDLIKEKELLFSRIEDASIARYSSGLGMQQEVLMAQTEKYMLLEKQEMLKQKIEAIESMLNLTIGRDVNSPLGRPVAVRTDYLYSFGDLVTAANENAPVIKAKNKMAESARLKVAMAEKEYYPDFTLNATYYLKSRQFPDMWSFTSTINIPLYFMSKQRPAVQEAEQLLSEAEHDLDAVKLMLASSIRDNYSMVKTAEKLMELYKNGLMPKTYQDFDSSLAGYSAGKTDALTVVSRLKALLDYELSYWTQFTEREKAIARIEALTAVRIQNSEDRSNGDKER